jgi:hypothetical protein
MSGASALIAPFFVIILLILIANASVKVLR